MVRDLRSVVHGPETVGPVLIERRTLLEPTLKSPQVARRLFRRFVEDAGRSDWLDAGELAISEVVTNAALHGHTAMELRLVAYEDRAYVEVKDFNATVPVQRHYAGDATTGRGMALVSALTAECGVWSLGDGGKVVWFRLGGPMDSGEANPAVSWELGDWPDPSTDDDHQRCDVVLESMPATLWLSARQHHDALLRELVLYRAEHSGVDVDLKAADDARSIISNALIDAIEEADAHGLTRPALPDGHPSPLPWVPEHLDLHFSVLPEDAGHFAALQDALDAAERLAMVGELLCQRGLPEIVAVRDWACEQVIAQLSGIRPAPWSGTALERFEIDEHGCHGENLTWDSSVVVDSIAASSPRTKRTASLP